MEPPKQQSSQIDYLSRNLYDDFLDQLPLSTNDRKKGLVLMRGKILREGLVYNCSNIADARVPLIGLEMFRIWYGQRNFPHPFSNGWMYDMGKLVVPNVFPDIDLLRVVAMGYDLVTWVIRDNDGRVLLSINIEGVQHVFDLSEPSVYLVPINLEEMK